MESTKTPNDNHVLVTPPDRYYSEAFNILLVDFDWGLTEAIINPLRSANVTLAIHAYISSDSDPAWLIDVASSSDIVLMDLSKTTNNDIVKGHIISKENVWYTGRPDLEKFWPRYTNDPLSLLIFEISKYQTKNTRM